MGLAIFKIRIMPESPDINLKNIEDDAKKIIDSEQGSNLRIEIEPIAFGLNAVNLTFTREETLDSDILIEKLRKINGVASGEIIDFRRAFG